MNKEIQKKIKDTCITQSKRAYLIAKSLKSSTPNNVTFVVSQKITLDNLKPDVPHIVTEIRFLPEVRIYHNKVDGESEYVEDLDIDNIEGKL